MLVYVAGPYRRYTDHTVLYNIAQARIVAIDVWKAGHTAICPHLNTALFDCDSKLPDDRFLTGDLEILARCDAVVLVPGWQESLGTLNEVKYAKDRNIPIYEYPALPDPHQTEIACPEQSSMFIDVIMRLYRTHLDKNADYSPVNVLATGEVGLLTRLWDKTARLLSLSGFTFDIRLIEAFKPREAKHEPVEDSYLDLACYAIIGLILRAQKWGK